MKASIGDIWLVYIPILSFNNKEVDFNIQKRPCLIVDNGRGVIVENDNRNLHVLKLTTQFDKYKRRLLKKWKEYGLKEKSYIRIELPLKIEKEQLVRKITKLSEEELLEMYNEIYNIINIDSLKVMSKKYKELCEDTITIG